MMGALEKSFPQPPACLDLWGLETKTASKGIPVVYGSLINGETISLVLVSVKKM